MDKDIVHAIWFNCLDLSDTQQKLLLALAYHCHQDTSCFPSVARLAQMIRRTPRQTRSLLRQLEKIGYITVTIRRGRGKSNRYQINRKHIIPILKKIGNPDFHENRKSRLPLNLKGIKEREKEELERLALRFLTPGSTAYLATVNGQKK